MKRRLERNIWLTYINGVLGWSRFFIPVLALFYIASQVTLTQFTIILGVFSLSTLLLEIPTGVIADLIGRKRTLLIARVCWIVELYLISFYNGFWIFLAAKIISGIGVSFWSGSGEALLYDSLKRLKREKDFKRINGNLQIIINLSMAIIFIIGSFLFAMNPKLPAIASLPFACLALFFTLFLTEPYKSRKKITFKNSLNHMKEGFAYFWQHSYVKYLTFYSWPIAATIAMMLSISSAYQEAIMIPIALIGVVATAGSLVIAFGAKISYNLEEKHGEKRTLFAIQCIMVLGIFLMSLMVNYIGVLFYLMICFGSGLFNVLISHYVNKHIETSHRATMISIKNFFDNLAIFIFFPILGFIISAKSMRLAFMFWGISLVILIIALWIYSRKLRISEIE